MRLLFTIISLSFLACKTPHSVTNKTPLSKSAYSYEKLILQKDTLPYRLLLPENYNKKRAYPLVLFLHGAGERGNDNELQLVHGSELFLGAEVREKYPAIVVFPQCAIDSTWSGYIWQEDGRIDYNHEQNGMAMVRHQVLLKSLLAPKIIRRGLPYLRRCTS